MRIIGPPSAAWDTVRANLPTEATALFRDQMLPALWNAAESLTVDPVGVVAQSGKETGWGKFGGNVRPWFYNPAGIKIRHVGEMDETTGDRPLAHQIFWSWDVGALAQVHHLRAYAGWPVPGLEMSPRAVWVVGKHRCENWADLGGRWAPSASYGAEIETTMRRLAGTP
jgi:N-acetylmuramoyl-L-alanine amidase